MKKITLLALLTFAIVSLKAQDDSFNQIYNKKNQPILPEKGDWVIGVDAAPFLEYIGNMALVSGSTNDAPEFAFTAQRPGQLFGKYYVQENKAFRIGLRIGYTASSTKDGNFSDPNEIDVFKQNALNIGISFGVEKHRPIRKRLLGFWGYEAGFNKTPYVGTGYMGTSIVTGKVTFDDAVDSENNYTDEGGNTYEVFARLLVGVEYFIAPKISLAGEFGLGLGYQNTGERSYDSSAPFAEKIIYDAGYSEFSVSNTASGAIVLLFHF
jgi:outer membrane protein W